MSKIKGCLVFLRSLLGKQSLNLERACALAIFVIVYVIYIRYIKAPLYCASFEDTVAVDLEQIKQTFALAFEHLPVNNKVEMIQKMSKEILEMRVWDPTAKEANLFVQKVTSLEGLLVEDKEIDDMLIRILGKRFELYAEHDYFASRYLAHQFVASMVCAGFIIGYICALVFTTKTL